MAPVEKRAAEGFRVVAAAIHSGVWMEMEKMPTQFMNHFQGRICMILVVAGAFIGLKLCGSGVGGGALAADKASTRPAWQSDEPSGGWNQGGFYIFNNVWNKKSKPGPQHIWANSYKDWGVTSTQTTTTAVRAYPCVQKNLKGGVKAGAFTRMVSTYAERGPGKGIYNASYDLWFNGLKKEVMFWVDSTHWGNLGQPLETVTLGGKRWKVYHEAGYTRFQLEKTEQSGTVDLLAGIQYMLKKGWLSPEDLAWQINFGFEICSTQNQPYAFRVNDYSLDAAW